MTDAAAPVSPLLIGLLLGLRHALDADHVAAMTTLVADEPRALRGGKIGALWGLGHGSTVLAVGGLLIAFGLRVPAPLEAVLELLVAAMLVLLGARSLRVGERVTSPASPIDGRKPVIVGVVHGLAGSAAAAILASTALGGLGEALSFLALFGLGTVAAMGGATLAMGVGMGAVPSAALTPLRRSTGILSLCTGLFLAGQVIGFGAERGG